MAFTPQIQKLIFQNPGKSAQFSNWEGRNTCLVRSYHNPTTKEEVQQILKEAYEKHEKVRVVGAGNLIIASKNTICLFMK
jgi:FAD/FMN-containing dehydrogenase